MNYESLKIALKEFDEAKVSRYITYLKEIESAKVSRTDNKPKNPWFRYFTEVQAADIYKKVAIDNLSIDGETITLQNKGKVMVSYNYQAYKNKLLNIYPETKFDIQLVCDGDDFSFYKESGKVIYSHKINNPFAEEINIIGAYCIIKNQRGEFLETLNITDIKKMRAAAKTDNVWETWFSEMVLKSVIKRACKRHFKDIITNIDALDNENYDLNRVGFDELLKQKIDNASFKDLSKIYKEEQKNVKDQVKFVELLSKRKEELISMLPEITKQDHKKAIQYLKDGKTIDQLMMIWKIDTETQKELISQAI